MSEYRRTINHVTDTPIAPSFDFTPKTGVQGAPLQLDLDEFVHEVRGPLASASIALEALQDDPHAAAILTASLNHLQDLLSSLVPANNGPTTLVEHLPTAVMIADPHRRVVLELNTSPDDKVCCTPVRFRQLIVNLVSNALKFSAPTSTVYVTAFTTDDHLVIQVKDNGSGMSTEDAALVFERGVRGDSHDHVPGDGLGLTIVRRLARSCGGDARLVQTDGHGSTFEITLRRIR